jgi:zinc/manganese transport system substrate-binding protein
MNHLIRLGLVAMTAVPASWALRAASSSTPSSTEPLRVLTTLRDLADIAREIGGDRVSVQSMYTGKENTHALTAKPSHLVAMSKADLFIQVGLSLETSFVPGLLEAARNSRVQPGAPGFVTVSTGWEALDVPTNVSRKAGDIHPQGNPHMNIDPRAGEFMADRILEGLVAVDPSGETEYRARHDDYVKRVQAAKARWDAMGAAWKDKKVVVYHQEYDYLIAYYGMVMEGKIEPKPGIAPTPNHTAELIDAMKRDHADAILTAVWSNNDTVARIAEKTGVNAVEVPNMCGGLPGTDTWIGMMDVLHQRLASVLGTGKGS